MICKCCKKDLPLKKFSLVTYNYTKKDGTQKVYSSIRKRCNSCTWKRNKPTLRIIPQDADSRLVAY